MPARITGAEANPFASMAVVPDACANQGYISTDTDEPPSGIEEQGDEPVWMPEQPYASSSDTIDDDMTDSPAPPYCVHTPDSVSTHFGEGGRAPRMTS